MKRVIAYILVLVVFGSVLVGIVTLRTTPDTRTGKEVWVMPVLEQGTVSWPCPVVIWFSEQFLSDGQAYQRRSAEFAGWKRSALRRRVTAELKRLSDNSWHRAESGIGRLLREKVGASANGSDLEARVVEALEEVQ